MIGLDKLICCLCDNFINKDMGKVKYEGEWIHLKCYKKMLKETYEEIY